MPLARSTEEGSPGKEGKTGDQSVARQKKKTRAVHEGPEKKGPEKCRTNARAQKNPGDQEGSEPPKGKELNHRHRKNRPPSPKGSGREVRGTSETAEKAFSGEPVPGVEGTVQNIQPKLGELRSKEKGRAGEIHFSQKSTRPAPEQEKNPRGYDGLRGKKKTFEQEAPPPKADHIREELVPVGRSREKEKEGVLGDHTQGFFRPSGAM